MSGNDELREKIARAERAYQIACLERGIEPEALDGGVLGSEQAEIAGRAFERFGLRGLAAYLRSRGLGAMLAAQAKRAPKPAPKPAPGGGTMRRVVRRAFMLPGGMGDDNRTTGRT